MYFERFWRKATPQDAIKQPSMVGRYKNDNGDWEIFNLTGYDSKPEISNHHWIFSNCCSDNAQVYDPPANFELGEGYEFVDAKTEPNAKDVEFWWHNNDWSSGKWETRPDYYGNLTGYDIYRRKIKPKYRLMQPNEVVHFKCLINHKKNKYQSLDPIGPGWIHAPEYCIGTLANDILDSEFIFACPIGEPVESYESFTWEDRYEITNKEICDKNSKKLIVVKEIQDIDGVLVVNNIPANDLMENYVFDGTKFPVGKRVTKIAE